MLDQTSVFVFCVYFLRSVDTLLNHDSFPPQQQEVDFRESFGEQLSPGTLV